MENESDKKDTLSTDRRGFLKGLGGFLACTASGGIVLEKTIASGIHPSRLLLFKQERDALRLASSEYDIIRTQFLDGHIGQKELVEGLRHFDRVATRFADFIHSHYKTSYAKKYVEKTQALVIEHKQVEVRQLVQKKKARLMESDEGLAQLKASFFEHLHGANDLRKSFKEEAILFVEDKKNNFEYGKQKLDRSLFLYESRLNQCIRAAKSCWDTPTSHHLCTSKYDEFIYERSVFFPLILNTRKTLDLFEEKKRAQFELSYQVHDTSAQTIDMLA